MGQGGIGTSGGQWVLRLRGTGGIETSWRQGALRLRGTEKH